MRFISLFSGIEAASVAWLPLGWTCAAVAEIDKFPCAVLKHHYPDVPNLGNVCGITRERLVEVGSVDAIVFGFPCQDLSVAGKRAGLKGARSGLFFEAMRIVEICRELWGTRWTIAENVPGLFSSNSGLDFAAVVGEMVGAKFAVPKAKWQNTGVALGPRGLVEWAVLDAQWFGVPQRRRRVFLVRDSGDWRSRPPVLSFPESLQGHTPPSREKRESAPTIPSRRIAGGGYGAGTRSLETDFDCDGGLVATAFGGNTGGPIDVATAYNAHGGRLDFESETFITGCLNANGKAAGSATQQNAETGMLVTHSLRADGFDASEDGTGRGTPLVPVAAHMTGAGFWQEGFGTLRAREQDSHENLVAFRAAGQDGFTPSEISPPVAGTDGGGAGVPTIAFSCKDSGLDCGDLSPTLRSMGHDSSHANAGGQVAVAFNLRGREGGSLPEPCDQASLRAASGGSSRSYVATICDVVNCNSTPETATELAFPLRSDDGSGNRQAIVATPNTLQYNGINERTLETDSVEILQLLRKEVGEEAFAEWGLGILNPFQSPQVLQSNLYGPSVRRETIEVNGLVNDSLPREETSSPRTVCEVPNEERIRCSPQGWEPHEQHYIQLRTYLSLLSRQGTPQGDALRYLWIASEGLGVLRQALSKIQETWRSICVQNPTSENVPDVQCAGTQQQLMREALHAMETRNPGTTAENQKRSGPSIVENTTLAIRRLTPVECCRLQAFPDDYLSQVMINGKPPADGPMYRALGNSMAVCCMEWIGKRVQLVDIFS